MLRPVLIKRAPSKNYESRYHRPGNPEGIIHDLPNQYLEIKDADPVNLAIRLAAGETIHVTDPFGTPIEWSMEFVV